MTNAVAKPQKVIIMKNGLSLFVEADRVKALEEILASGSGHRFIRIDDKTINSAEIAGIYSIDQYDELQRVKRGEWKCPYSRWHMRKETCECRAEIARRDAHEREKALRERENKPLSAEEQARRKKAMDEGFAMIRKSLGVHQSRGYQLSRKELIKYERVHGRPYEVPPGTAIIEDADETSGEITS
jgi:hypothetical protein